jgi:hypothetical protein
MPRKSPSRTPRADAALYRPAPVVPLSQGGITYTLLDVAPDGSLVGTPMHAPNLVPTEGLNHLLDVVLHGAEQYPAWYVALFEGNYTPTFDVTADTFAQLATECTAYQGAGRLEFKEAPAVGGATSNAANLSTFTFTADKTVYGAALLSASGKNSRAGKLLSIARFPQPRQFAAGQQLAVLASPSAANPA